MKNTLLVFLLWIALFATALMYGQSNFRLNKTESFNFAIVVDPSASIEQKGLNIGAEIGKGTMIDMGAVLGGRAIVGENSHIGANAVLAGVIEPASADPVRIGNNVTVGANAVVLGGVQVGDNAVVGAGAIVTKDVAANAVVAGVPAKVLKIKDQKTTDKTHIEDTLRKL